MTAVAACDVTPNLSIRFQRFVGFDSSQGHPAHVSSLSGPGTTARYAASYPGATACGGFGHLSPLSCCLSAAAVRFLAVLSRPGYPPSLRSAYRQLVVSIQAGTVATLIVRRARRPWPVVTVEVAGTSTKGSFFNRA